MRTPLPAFPEPAASRSVGRQIPCPCSPDRLRPRFPSDSPERTPFPRGDGQSLRRRWRRAAVGYEAIRTRPGRPGRWSRSPRGRRFPSPPPGSRIPGPATRRFFPPSVAEPIACPRTGRERRERSKRRSRSASAFAISPPVSCSGSETARRRDKTRASPICPADERGKRNTAGHRPKGQSSSGGRREGKGRGRIRESSPDKVAGGRMPAPATSRE